MEWLVLRRSRCRRSTTPYYYAADLQSWNIKAELTASHTAAYYRFTRPADSTAHLVLSMEDGSALRVVGDSAVEGSEKVGGSVAQLSENDGETREYFYAEFSKPFRHYQTWQKDALSQNPNQAGNHIGFVADESGAGGDQIEVRVGLSYISTEQAQKNLKREMSGRSFDQVKEATRELWNNRFEAVKIDGGSERQRTIFYTALYRSLGRMTDITEDGRYFSGYDHKVHESNGHDFYVDDGLWDTYRSLHPLQLLLEAPQQEDMIRSYLRMYEESGWLPSFPSVAGEQSAMIGHHAAAYILDAYMKGYRNFNVEEAYQAIRKNETQSTMLPWKRGPLTNLD